MLSHTVSSAFEVDHHEPIIHPPQCPDPCGDTAEVSFIQDVLRASPAVVSADKMGNFMGDEQSTILALGIVFPILSTLAVVLRFEARRFKRIHVGADDWTILAALVYAMQYVYHQSVLSRTGPNFWNYRDCLTR